MLVEVQKKGCRKILYPSQKKFAQETQMKTGWLILTIAVSLIATYMLANSIYWIIIGYSQSPEFVVGTFILPVLMYLFAYEYCWKKAKQP